LLLDIKPSKAVFVVPAQLNPFPTFTIDVKTLTGKIFQVGINDATTGLQLNTAIQDQEGIPPDQQRIIFDGTQLTDGEFLRLKEMPAR
jgi:ubiquitin